MQNPFEYRSDPEGSGGYRPQRKIGLETPLSGRYWGENKKLVFSPPNSYQGLVIACIAGGLYITIGTYLQWWSLPWFLSVRWLGPAVLLAGFWAVLSMEYVVFDLRSRTYLRREGGGIFKRTRTGSLTDLDAVVLYCENYPLSVVGRVVVYRIVIHWKNARVPLLVADREQASLPSGVALNHVSGRLLGRAQSYAQALGIRLHDNSHFHSAPPQRPV